MIEASGHVETVALVKNMCALVIMSSFITFAALQSVWVASGYVT